MNLLKRDLVKAGTAALVLGVCTVTVKRMAKRGDIPFTLTPSGYRLYDVRDLIAIREQRAKRTGSQRGQPSTREIAEKVAERLGAGTGA